MWVLLRIFALGEYTQTHSPYQLISVKRFRNLRADYWLPVLVLCILILSACGVNRITGEAAPDRAVVDSLLQKTDSLTTAMASLADSATVDSITEVLNRVSIRPDSIPPTETDSLTATPKTADSLTDLMADSSKRHFKLDDVVEYKAQDSLILEGANMAYLYGESSVKYTSKSLESHYMRINLDSSQVFSRYVLDSMGKPAHMPVFKDGEDSYQSKTMSYNFNTERGYITGVTTQQGEGYLTSNETKKLADNTMFMKGVRYTTCDLHQHPHFYINIDKAKMRPGKNLVSGPVNLVILDVPLPIGLPFGFFPFNETYSSGILMPAFGEDYSRGFFARNGGYYFAFNDYVDLALTGEIYSKGSWGVGARSTYRKHYRFNGSFDFSYLVTTQGDKYVGDYSKAKDLRLSWTHTQDAKADPVQNFSASVNFSTSSFNQNSLDHLYNPATRGQNTKSSSINYSRSFPGTPWRLSASFSIDQRSVDSTINVTLPDLSLTMSRIYPFKRKNPVGKERWFEKIAISYSGQLRSTITSKEDEILKKNYFRDWKNGIIHRIPITASYKLLDYVDLTFNADYTERWYSGREVKQFDPQQKRMVTVDTLHGFNRVFDFNGSMNASTTLYGFYKPLPFMRKKLEMVRHVVTPHIALSYRPDFGHKRWGYWHTLNYVDEQGKLHTEHYTQFDGQIFGHPERGKSASINFGMENSLEAKWRKSIKKTEEGTENENEGKEDADKEEFDKISLIENFSWDWGYNMAADSFKWSDISTNLRLKFTDQLGLSLSGNWDPYVYEYNVSPEGAVRAYAVDKIRLFSGKGFGSLRSTGTSFNFSLSPEKVKSFFALFGKKKKEDDNKDSKDNNKSKSSEIPGGNNNFGNTSNPNDFGSMSMNDPASKKHEEDKYDQDGYMDYKLPWNLSFNYGIQLVRDVFNIDKKGFDYKFVQNLSCNGNIQPTKNWSIQYNLNYNFELHKITNLTLNLVRDMHCWQITASAIPLGPYKSYTMTIAVKSALLRDLKYDKQSSSRGRTNLWY